ncbi:uncharacterized protein G2W53_000990 [Senna tora]|uniref:Uncharacterized protein n=1 Tax=Senna tora TaxID=362788 RepID=A0A834XGN4_9FABA|nr:uncharacterized protein G2W53_000990 [Senna tora]
MVKREILLLKGFKDDSFSGRKTIRSCTINVDKEIPTEKH